MLKAAELEKPECVFHLGDGVRDAATLLARFPGLLLHCVCGNCDWNDAGFQEEGLAELCGAKIYFTHGHLYGVKSGLGRLAQKGLSAGAAVALFGHTHKAYIGRSGELWLFNPGSVCRGGTYGVLHLKEDGIQCEIKEAGGREVFR
jgi:hypothetical protein